MRFAFLTIFFLLPACASRETVAGDESHLPKPFTLELRVYESGKRSVYYVLRDDASLSFGGGRDANIRQAPEPAGRLTEVQLTELWKIIHEHRLLDADGRLFPKAERVRYEVKLKAGNRRASYTSVDDNVSGLEQLDASLYRMQAAVRYGDTIRAVEERIQKGGEEIKKK